MPNAAHAFFAARQAHSDVAVLFCGSLKRLGEHEVRGDLRSFSAPYAVTSGVVFAGASDMSFAYYRLNATDRAIALQTGAETTDLGEEWVRLTLFRANWPQFDLGHWALRAYDYARTGAQSPQQT